MDDSCQIEQLKSKVESELKNSHWPEVVQLCSDLREKFPKDPFGYTKAVAALRRLNQIKDAFAICAKGIERIPKDPNCWILFSEIACSQLDFQKALDNWKKFREMFPREFISYEYAINICWNSMAASGTSQYCSLADDLCNKGLRIFPEKPKMWFLFAETAMHNADYKTAIKRLYQIIEKFPEFIWAYMRMIDTLCESWLFIQADAFCEKCKKLFLNHPLPLVKSAEIAMQRCEYAEAFKRFDALRKQFPNVIDGYRGGIEALCKLQNFEHAEEICAFWKTLFPQSPEPEFFYAMIAFKKQDFKTALYRYEKFLHQYPQSVDSYIAKARVNYCKLQLEHGEVVEDMSEKDEQFINLYKLPYPVTLAVKSVEGCKTVIATIIGANLKDVGFGDLIWGTLSAFNLARNLGLDYRIHWTHPFDLIQFLKPALYDWRINKRDLIYHKQFAIFISVPPLKSDSYSRLENFINETDFYQYHVSLAEVYEPENFQTAFNSLFQPQKFLAEDINKHLQNLDKYISVTFRFMNLLGDFEETLNRAGPLLNIARSPLSTDEQNTLIEKCINELQNMTKGVAFKYKIFVSSDSGKFLERAGAVERVYTVPGTRYHPSKQHEQDIVTLYAKSFLDFFLIKNADKSFSFHTGNMYTSYFPRLAALCDGRECTSHFF